MNIDRSHLTFFDFVSTRLISSNGEEWKIYFYKEFAPVFYGLNKELDEEIEKTFKMLIDEPFTDFKTQVEIKGGQYLVGFFYSSKEIRIYSPRIGQELFVLEEYPYKNHASYHELKKHVEKVTVQLGGKNPSMLDIITHKYGLADFLKDSRYFDLEYDLQEVLLKLIKNIDEYKMTLFEKSYNWFFHRISRSMAVKLRFFEYLFIILTMDDDTGSEFKKNVLESLEHFKRILATPTLDKSNKLSSRKTLYLISIIKRIVKWIPPFVLKSLTDGVIIFLSQKFISNGSIEEVDKIIKKLKPEKRMVSFDPLGEKSTDLKTCDEYTESILQLIDRIDHALEDESGKFGLKDKCISIKLSALTSNATQNDLEENYRQIKPRLTKILNKALNHGVFVSIDAELYILREMMLYTLERLLREHAHFRVMNLLGVTLQAYFRDSYEAFKIVVDVAKKFSTELHIRLVKGAYFDEEKTYSASNDWPGHVFLNKEETDLHYRQLMVKILDNSQYVRLIIASHNPLDHAFSEVLRSKYYPHSREIEHQCLNMTHEALSRAMVNMNWRVRNHIPVGPFIKGAGYLVRRVMENVSTAGVLSQIKMHGIQKIMDTPIKTHLDKKKKLRLECDKSFRELSSTFHNISPLKIFLSKNRILINQQLDKFKNTSYSHAFDYQKFSGKILTVKCPESPDLILGRVGQATSDDVTKTIHQLNEAYLTTPWAQLLEIERSIVLIKAANLLTARRHEFAALIHLETGINVKESYREVDYAIDYLNFHAREYIRLKKKNNHLKSRGVVAIFSAWSSPLASLAGYVSAALVTGNTVLVKPAIQTPLICHRFIDLLIDAGIPATIVECLIPENKDDLLGIVKHKLVAGLAYEGPLQMGKRFYGIFSQKIVKNTLFNNTFKADAILSLGGKNGMIITASADLDMALTALFNTTLCRSGQMASCPTRIIVDKKIKNQFIYKLKIKLDELLDESKSGLNRKIDPIIDQFEKERLLNVIKNVKTEIADYAGSIIVDHTQSFDNQYIGPLVVSLDSLRASKFESLACSELFGPILYVIEYDTLEHAQFVFNSGEYVRSGSIFSQSIEEIKYLVENLMAGSIHVNKYDLQNKVAVMPQGGFKLSGTGPKMGGRALLYAFMVNDMRENEPGDLEEGRGSDYRFTLMRPSGLGWQGRLLRLDKVMEMVVLNFEHLFLGVYGEYKEIIIKFAKWIKRDFVSFNQGPHVNALVDGEDNFNDFKKTGEQAVFLVYNPQVEFSTFMRFLGALVMGVGITVIARNEQSFSWWSNLKTLIIKSGISKQNFDVFYPTEEILYQAITEPGLSYIVIDSNLKKLEELLKIIFMEDENILRFKKILTPHNAPAFRDYKQYLSEFTWIRSISINRKRNGVDIHSSEKKLSDYLTTDEYFADLA